VLFSCFWPFDVFVFPFHRILKDKPAMPLGADDHYPDSQAKTSDGESEYQGEQSDRELHRPINPPSRQTPPTPATNPPPSEKPCKWRENTKLILEIIGLAVLIVYTVFSGLQWAQIRWTNRLTREALNGSNVALQQTLDKMQQQITQMSRMADNTRIQATNTDTLAGFSKGQLEVMQSGQRPWLAVEASIKDRGGDTIDYGAAIKNFGSVPAIRVGFDLTVKAAKQITGESIPEACRSAKEKTSQGIYVIPGYSFTYNPHVYIVGIGAAPEPPFLVGCISYFGQFNEPHHTEVCLRPDFRDPQHVTFQPCPNMPLKAD
jgi:hypothetical protein